MFVVFQIDFALFCVSAAARFIFVHLLFGGELVTSGKQRKDQNKIRWLEAQNISKRFDIFALSFSQLKDQRRAVDEWICVVYFS